MLVATNAWKKLCITEQEKQSLLKLYEMSCVAQSESKKAERSREAKQQINLALYEAAEALVYEMSKVLLTEKLKTIPLNNVHFAGLKVKGHKSKEYSRLQGFGLELGELVLGYCVILQQDPKALARLEKQLSENNQFSNVLLFFIDQEELLIQLWQGRQKLQISLDKNSILEKSEVNRVINSIRRFFQLKQNLKCSPQQLAENLATKALLVKSIVGRELLSELKRYKLKLKESKLNEGALILELKSNNLNHFWHAFPLLRLYFMFHAHLMKMETSSTDKSRKEGFLVFSDVYAQTIAYGLLAARWMSKDKATPFIRKYIKSLLPSSSDFLKNIFVELLEVKAGPQIEFCIKELFSILYQASISEIFRKEDRDPVIHFYEDFLDAYGKNIKNSRGVYYTPEEVVNFIVCSIDEQLKTEFGLALGLASTKTWSEVLSYLNKNKPEDSRVKQPNLVKGQDFFVRILDPATGTGTFIKRVLVQIRSNLKTHWKSLGWSLEQMQMEWKAYVSGTQGVEKDYRGQGLLDRLNAFELMMAPYIITHLRMGLLLQEDLELPFEFSETDRLNVFLTDSLEHPFDRSSPGVTLKQMDSLSIEAHQADVVKQAMAITVVVGNPPYNIKSKNKGEWILRKLQDYKKDLDEKKNNLNDDYIKFIRLGQYYIKKSGLGLLGVITNNSFLDGVTHRQMRKSLLKDFSTINLVNLHGGNDDINERSAFGYVKNRNIFTIQVGISISLMTRSNSVGQCFFVDIQESKTEKVKILNNNIFSSLESVAIPSKAPNYFFVQREKLSLDIFSLKDLFIIAKSGIKTDRDALFYSLDEEVLSQRIQTLLSGDFSKRFKDKYKVKDSSSYKITEKIVGKEFDDKYLKKVLLRPFSLSFIYYDNTIVSRGAYGVMQHMLSGRNIGLIFKRGDVNPESPPCFVSRNLINCRAWSKAGTRGMDYFAPRVIDLENNVYNFKQAQIDKIKSKLGQKTNELMIESNLFSYVYACLHSKRFTQEIIDILSYDYPHVPYPKNIDLFHMLAAKGQELCSIHLLESELLQELKPKLRNRDGSTAKISQKITQIRPGFATAKEEKKSKEWNGKIWINYTQYFEGVSELAWQFYIGGYQPIQLWLKERKGRSLNSNEVTHYSKMIKAIEETHRIMKEIDQIDFF